MASRDTVSRGQFKGANSRKSTVSAGRLWFRSVPREKAKSNLSKIFGKLVENVSARKAKLHLAVYNDRRFSRPN